MPLKVELLEMEAPETYVESIAKTPALYIRAELMPLSLDEKARIVDYARTKGGAASDGVSVNLGGGSNCSSEKC